MGSLFFVCLDGCLRLRYLLEVLPRECHIQTLGISLPLWYHIGGEFYFEKEGTAVNPSSLEQIRLPMVEIYETIEGEGQMAGFPTVFVRLFGCQLRCTWCDTPYSYAPAEPEEIVSIQDVLNRLESYSSRRLCLTGGEPLIHGDRVVELLRALAANPKWLDIHVETNGAVDVSSFINAVPEKHIRYVMDYKLPGSGEYDKMNDDFLHALREQDELKFVIADETDYLVACSLIRKVSIKAQVLFSPVFESMPAKSLAERILADKLDHVKLNIQMHKLIWPPAQRGV